MRNDDGVVVCSDLALRNCLLTSDLTVRIGDYGLSHNQYKVSPLSYRIKAHNSIPR